MKKTILLAALGLISLSALGKDKPDYIHQKPESFKHLLELLEPRFPRIGTTPYGKRRIRSF